MTNLRTTQTVEITDAKLDAVYPEIRLARRDDDYSTPAECVCDAVDAANIKCSLATTLRDVPAIDDEEVEEDDDCWPHNLPEGHGYSVNYDVED